MGCTQGRCLEPVVQDSQEEFQVREPQTLGDQTLLSLREGSTLAWGRSGEVRVGRGEVLSSHLSLRVQLKPPQKPRPGEENKGLLLL